MIKKNALAIEDFSGGQDTKTPIISMALNRSPNMRNWHCGGVKNRLIKRGGYAKLNSSAVTSDGLDVFYPCGYQTYDYALRDNAVRTQISQGFKPNTSSTVTKVRVWLKKTGSPTGNINIEIQTDSSGIPSGTAVTNGTSANVDVSTLSTSYSWITFTFATNPSLTSGTQYHIVLQGSFTISTTVYINWGADDYDVIYADGGMSVYDGSTWTSKSNYDACFEVYITNGARGNDGFAMSDFGSKNILLGVFGTTLYKMDKNVSGTPDGTWDSINAITSSRFWTFADWQSGTILINCDTGLYKYTSDTAVSLTAPDDDEAGLGDNSDSEVRAGQTFVLSAQSTITGVKLKFGANVGAPSGNVTVRIETTSAGLPTGNLAHANLTVAISPTASAWNTATFASSATIAAGTYAIVLTCNNQSTDVRWILRIASTDVYTDGSRLYSSNGGSSWTTSSGDMLFEVLCAATGAANATLVSNAPLGKFMIIWKNYAFIFGLRGSPNNGRYSDLNDYTTWTASNTFSNAFNTQEGDVITGVKILKGKLYVFKKYSIHRISYLGSNPTFEVDQIFGVGCPSHHAIKEVDLGGDIGQVLVFPTMDKKLAIFDGYNVPTMIDVLSEETNDLFASSDDQPISFADFNYTYADQFHAVDKSDTSEYILYCVLGSDTTVGYGFVFDYKTMGIFPYDNQVFASSCYALSTNKKKILYCSGYAGLTWTQESGNDDDGSAINAYVVSGKIRPSSVSILNKALQLGINIKEISSGSTLNMGFQFRIDWNVSWNTVVNFNYNRNDEYAFGKTVLFDIGTIENMLQIKITENSTNPAPTIYGIDLYGQPLGLEVGDRASS